MSETPLFNLLNNYRERGKYHHSGIWGDFGYTWCRACGGEWEGPEEPEDSPCDVEAQAIRRVRESWEYWMESGKFIDADFWMALFPKNYPAFDESGGLKDAYWS